VTITLATNLEQVQERIERAAQRAGRNPAEITLVGVSKTVGREVIEEAYRAGLRVFGENRVPDAEEKFSPLPYQSGQGQLHLIGHLQSNKAKRAANLFDMIHSVDDYKLAVALDRHCAELGKKLPILLQVNVSGELSKEGLEPSQLTENLEKIAQLPNLELRGLMTIAPFVQNPEETRPIFRQLRRLFENQANSVKMYKWRDLSMGMTNDFEVAIEEGATLVRVGRAIFQ
jgi:pyridoxal phosphate enzyme (YggS family)